MTPFSCTASVDGLGKKGDVYSFVLCLSGAIPAALKVGDAVSVEGVSVTVRNLEDEYLSFELPLKEVLGTPLVEVEIGSQVTVQC